MPLPNMGLTDQLDQYAAFRKQQQVQLGKHQKFAQGLQQKQDQLNKRSTDLDVTDRLMKIVDPTVPKSARQFLSRELAQYLGVDPKSDSAKNVTTMIMGLDPDTSMALKSMLAQQMETAEPGQINSLVKGILSGQMPMHSFVGQIQAAKQQYQNAGMGEGAETAKAQAKPQTSSSAPQQGAAPQPRTPAAPFSGAGGVKSFEGPRTIPETERPVDPMLVRSLGLDPKQTYRASDLTNQGYSIPHDATAQRALADSLTNRRVGVSSSLVEASKINKIVSGDPAAIGTVGDAVMSAESALQQVRNGLRLLRPGMSVEIGPNSADWGETERAAENAAGSVITKFGLTQTAQNAAIIKSSMLNLAYRMALARDIPGNRLTNAIIQQHLAQLGSSGSPAQLTSTLKDTIASTYREYDAQVQAQIGVPAVRTMSDAEIGTYAQNAEMLPLDIATQLRDELQQRKDGNRPGIQPSSPTVQEEQQTLGEKELQKKTFDIQKQEQDLEYNKSREERAIRGEQRSEAREDRLVTSAEQSSQLAQEKFAYEKQQDAARMQQAQSDKIGKAFMNFGEAIANSFKGFSVGGGGGQQQGQDIGAFRLAPAPQRVPPQPPRGVQ